VEGAIGLLKLEKTVVIIIERIMIAWLEYKIPVKNNNGIQKNKKILYLEYAFISSVKQIPIPTKWINLNISVNGLSINCS
jgi:hypothetical protein